MSSACGMETCEIKNDLNKLNDTAEQNLVIRFMPPCGEVWVEARSNFFSSLHFSSGKVELLYPKVSLILSL